MKQARFLPLIPEDPAQIYKSLLTQQKRDVYKFLNFFKRQLKKIGQTWNPTRQLCLDSRFPWVVLPCNMVKLRHKEKPEEIIYPGVTSTEPTTKGENEDISSSIDNFDEDYTIDKIDMDKVKSQKIDLRYLRN